MDQPMTYERRVPDQKGARGGFDVLPKQAGMSHQRRRNSMAFRPPLFQVEARHACREAD